MTPRTMRPPSIPRTVTPTKPVIPRCPPRNPLKPPIQFHPVKPGHVIRDGFDR